MNLKDDQSFSVNKQVAFESGSVAGWVRVDAKKTLGIKVVSSEN